MPLVRTSIVRGPAIVTFGGASIYFHDGLKLEAGLETFDLATDSFGKIDERVRNRKIVVSGTPDGAWAAYRSILLPYASTPIGSSVFGADSPLVVITKAGRSITINAAAVTKMPSALFSSQKQVFGPLEFTGLGSDNTLWTAANSLYTETAAAFADTNFDPTKIITDQWTVALGTSPPWSGLSTQDGVTVDWDLKLEPVHTDSEGLVDLTLASLACSAKMIPVGITEAQLLAQLGLQGTGNVPGRSLNAGGATLTLTGVNSGKTLVINGMALKKGPMEFGAAKLRIGEIELVSTRNFAGGIAAAVFSMT